MNLENLDIYVAGTIEIKTSIRKQIEESGCMIVEFPNRRTETGKYFFSLVKFIRSNDIEVIHAHGNSGTLAIEMTAAWLGGCKKRIAHSHNTKCDQVKADKILRPFFNVFYTDGLACGEEAGKWLFGNRKFTVLANGRDVEKYKFNEKTRKLIRDEYGIKNEIAIGHVGGFFEQKNHKFLVEIYKELRTIDPECKLFMIGDGPLKKSIEKSCEGIGVFFTGNVDNVHEYLSAMDGMLLPSLFEGLPLVTVEWQINGLPSVISDVITSECIFTNNIEYESLDNSPKKWAITILKLVERMRDRRSDNYQSKARAAGYDLFESARQLQKLYYM